MAVIATGFFDGVHNGHKHVIDTLLSAAKECGEQSMVITFWPHPRNVLQHDAGELRLLTSLNEKKECLHAMGVDKVEVLDFSRDFSRMTAKDYLEDIVKGRFGGTSIVLGYDNRMGSDGLTHDQIGPLAQSLGLKVIEVPEVKYESSSTAVSSTRIREALSRGDINAAVNMLGREYSLHGVVVSGNHIGRTIGFPTANMQLYEPLKLIPKDGVYLVRVSTLGETYFGMTNIGVRPTVNGTGSRTIETHIFDFDEMIYGLDIKIEFMDHIRDEQRFESLDALAEQLESDRQKCLSIIKEGYGR